MADSLECPVCLERFDRKDRKPKFLHCGHSCCPPCVANLHRAAGNGYACPVCRKLTRVPPEELVDNFYLLTLLDAPLPPAAPAATMGLWCLDCDAEARLDAEPSLGCHGHKMTTIAGLQQQRREHSKDAVVLLERASSAHRDTVRRLADLAPAVQAELQQQMDAALRADKAVQAALSQLEAAQAGTAAEWQRAAGAAQAASDQEADRLAEDALRLLGSARRCRLAVSDADGERWHGNVALDGRAALLAALLLLHCDGGLQPLQPDSASEGAVAAAVREEQPGVRPAAAQPASDGAGGPRRQQPTAEAIPELNVYEITQSNPEQRTSEKAELLERVRRCGVRRLVYVYCHRDPDWALSLLRVTAGRLEELNVYEPREAHLLALLAAPGLRRLEVYSCDGALDERPPELPAPARPGSLQCLRVEGLPRATLRSLLRHYAASLASLWLGVGTPGGGDWPTGCSDLHALLAECGLAALRRLVLRRFCVTHNAAACRRQLQAVRGVLPAAKVLCQKCDKVPNEYF